MYLDNPFKEFDPFTELELPFPEYANQIVKKMLKVLEGRSREEFKSGFTVVIDLTMGGQLKKRKKRTRRSLEESSIEEIVEQLADYESPADVLKMGIAFTPDKRLAGYSVEELFAILALAILGEAQQTESEYRDEKWVSTPVIGLVAEAAEAAAYAEGILMGRSLSQAIMDNRRRQTSDAAKAGNRFYDYWKRRYVDWYETQSLPSSKKAKANRAQAVNRFYEDVLLPEVAAEIEKPTSDQVPGKAELRNRSKENITRTLRNHLVKTLGNIKSD